MTQPTQLIGEIYCMPIPEGAKDFEFEIDPAEDWYQLTYMLMMIDDEDSGFYGEDQQHCVPLPPGNWELICTTKECTEEQAASIVQIISNCKLSGKTQYRRYDRDPVKDTPAKCWTRDSRHALETLLTSKGLDPNKNYVLIKKVS